MNKDEIKEKLNYFRKYNTFCENTMISEIEVYIDNLREENEKLNNKIHDISETLNETYNNRTELRNENERLKEENEKLKKEPYELKRHIKKLNRRIRYLEKELENKNEYIKELEDIEDNRLIILLRHIKDDEILDFHYSCARTQNNGKFEDSLTYNIYVKRKYNDLESEGEENVKD